MKRSKINRIIADAIDLFAEHHLALPPFADWTPAEWRARAGHVRGIVERGLGWDVTDFGRGDFERVGLVLFTLRNGLPEDSRRKDGVLYAEKVMAVRAEQVTPLHFHRSKTEDIINRGGGDLAICVHAADDEERLSDGPVSYASDGQSFTANGGSVVTLEPGASLTLPPRLYHSFWAVDAPVVAGEVSTVNDDRRDNRFLEEAVRFPVIDEDAEPFRLLASDYARYLQKPLA